MASTNVAAAEQLIKAALFAALNASPNDPGLSDSELRTLVVGRQGVGPGSFEDALRAWEYVPRDSIGRISASSREVHEAMMQPARVPDALRPAAALNALGAAFDHMANELGARVPVEKDMLRAHCEPLNPHDLDRALALLVVHGELEQKAGKFRRRRTWNIFAKHHEGSDFPLRITPLAAELLTPVREVFARRGGAHAPSEAPSDRFAAMLTKQGWSGLASWWKHTATEMRGLSDQRNPTAVCVLCGALLEASLVAIARPAQNAQEWRQKFLQNPPEKWKLGELLDQAKESKLFSPAQVALAQTLMDVRNRIHAGAFASGSTFSPPHTDAHQATLARAHLELLIGAILEWPTVKVLT